MRIPQTNKQNRSFIKRYNFRKVSRRPKHITQGLGSLRSYHIDMSYVEQNPFLNQTELQDHEQWNIVLIENDQYSRLKNLGIICVIIGEEQNVGIIGES